MVRRRPTRHDVRKAAARVGGEVVCPCCGSSFLRFAPYRGRANRMCWSCGALERHRELALFLASRPELLRPGLRILHVAPERPLRALLLAAQPGSYVTADLEEDDVDVHMDLTAAPFDDGAFDVILCNHVMEHIPDDASALREIRRMLAPGGWAVVMTPIVQDITTEDPSIEDPAERLRLFGQEDHVRRYGWDYVDRLQAAGLLADVTRLEHLPEADVRRYRLRNLQGVVEPLFFVRPQRAAASGVS
jgi:hypothetical protein